MTLHEYLQSREVAATRPPFYALVMAAMVGADSHNAELLQQAFPEVWKELQARYNAPGGRLPSDGGG